jgi:hypothetical protein
MAQLFSSRASAAFRVVLLLLPAALAGAAALGALWARSDGAWGVGTAPPQPVPFRHDLHAGALQIDCRHCHSAVERSASAGMPSAATCMSCHTQVLIGASSLAPVRSARALGQPLTWSSVSRLPEHAYFHHGAHVAAGTACATCHGAVERMAQTVRAHTLSMGWCLDCHRRGEPRLTDCSTCHR